jgi:hypothetical protein
VGGGAITLLVAAVVVRDRDPVTEPRVVVVALDVVVALGLLV